MRQFLWRDQGSNKDFSSCFHNISFYKFITMFFFLKNLASITTKSKVFLRHVFSILWMGCRFKAYIVHVVIINTNFGEQTYLSKAMKFKLKKRERTSSNTEFWNPYKKGIMGISCVKWWFRLHPIHLIPPSSLEL